MEKISIARNPRARHDYHLLETWEAGLVLTGTEVKSLRDRKASLNEAYAHVRNGEVWLEGMTIAHYGPGSYNNPPPARSRKLLLHKREIRKLLGATTQKGLTVVPLEVYFKDGLAKVAIAGVVFLSLWSAAHRLRITCYDLGLRADTAVAGLAYAAALAGTGAAVLYLLRI